MLTARMLSELSEVAMRDARAAVDPKHSHDDREEDAEPTLRSVSLEDVGESVYLNALSEALWRAAVAEGWEPYNCPWLSDEENAEILLDVWERVLP